MLGPWDGKKEISFTMLYIKLMRLRVCVYMCWLLFRIDRLSLTTDLQYEYTVLIFQAGNGVNGNMIFNIKC
jgi:hypothetical protein